MYGVQREEDRAATLDLSPDDKNEQYLFYPPPLINLNVTVRAQNNRCLALLWSGDNQGTLIVRKCSIVTSVGQVGTKNLNN